MTEVLSVAAVRDSLGEGPVWDAAEQALYWVDIEGCLLQRLDPRTGALDRWRMPERLGSFALRERDGAILALESGFALYDLGSDTVEWIENPERDLPHNRMNDGKCDRQGRFWAGTMDDRAREKTGALYRVDADHSVHRMVAGIGISNALAWSPDGRVLYFADTMERAVYACDHDPATGAIANRRVFVAPGDGPGSPDGATVDEEGFLWNAQWDGWRIVRYAPDGTVDRVVALPVQRPTSCAFGGPDLRTLFITSATVGLEEATLAAQPLAGHLLAIDMDVRGIAERRFAG